MAFFGKLGPKNEHPATGRTFFWKNVCEWVIVPVGMYETIGRELNMSVMGCSNWS